VRIGTPALTTRGMKQEEMQSVGKWILAALRSPKDEPLHKTIRAEVKQMCDQFPVPAAVCT
jgi:glycine hydroxymethyltransferase